MRWDPPPWKPEALIWIVLGAVGMPVATLIPLDDLSLKRVVLALVAIPIGAVCGLVAWGYAENISRRS